MTSPLQLRDVHRALDQSGIGLEERDDVMHDLASAASLERFAEQHPKLARVPAVAGFRRTLDECWSRVGQLLKHARRTAKPQLRSYMESLQSLQGTFAQRCNHRLCTTLQRHATHCEAILKNLQTGRYDDSYASLCRSRLHEDLAKDAHDLVKQIGRLSSDDDADFQTAEPEEEADHEKFVKAMEKEFDVSAHRWEPVREGLIIYFDEENTGKLAKALGMQGDQMQPNDEFGEFCDEHGYLMIRRGMPQDIKFGGFPSAASRWIFVYAPHEIDDWTDEEEIEDKDDERKKDNKKDTDRLIKDIEDLQLDTKPNKSVLQTAKRLGGSATAGISGTIHKSR